MYPLAKLPLTFYPHQALIFLIISIITQMHPFDGIHNYMAVETSNSKQYITAIEPIGNERLMD